MNSALSKALLLTVTLVFCVLARAETLDDLDKIVAKAEGLDAFLASPYLVEEYYTALEKYYGPGKMNRAAFDQIMGQLREIKEKVPALKARLWETTGLGKEFAIETAVKTHGRTLDAANFNAAHAARLEAWRTRGGAFATEPDAGKFRAAVRGTLQKLQSEIDAFEEAAGKGVEGRRDRAEFFKDLRAKPEYAELAAGLLYRKFTSEEITDKIGSLDADLILDTFNTLRQGLRDSFVKDGIDIGGLATFLQSEIPTLPEMLEKTAEFPVEKRVTKRGTVEPVGSGGKAVYRFRPIPRRIHGIWKGIPLGECVGGGIIANTSEERWATVALKDTQLHHIEKVRTGPDGAEESSYLGFVQNVPLSRRGKTVSSVDFGAQILRSKVVVEHPTSHERETTTLYSLWLDKMTETLPRGWSGMVVSESNAINNAGLLETVRSSAAYGLGEELGNASGWHPLDDVGKRISRYSHKDPYGYSGSMIFDARGIGAGKLRRLDPAKKKIFDDPAAADKIFKRGTWAEKVKLARALQDAGWLPKAMRDYLGSSAHYRTMLSWLDADQAVKNYVWARTWPDRKKNFIPSLVALLVPATLGLLAHSNQHGALMGIAAGLGLLTVSMPKPWIDKLQRIVQAGRLLKQRADLERVERALAAGRPYPKGGASVCRVILPALLY